MKHSERTLDKLKKFCKSFLICFLTGTALYALSSASPLGCIAIGGGMFVRGAGRSESMGHTSLIISAVLITAFLIWTVSRTFIKEKI